MTGYWSMALIIDATRLETFRRKAQQIGFRVLAISYVPEISWFLAKHPTAFTLAHFYNRVVGALGLDLLWGYMVVTVVKI